MHRHLPEERLHIPSPRNRLRFCHGILNQPSDITLRSQPQGLRLSDDRIRNVDSNLHLPRITNQSPTRPI